MMAAKSTNETVLIFKDQVGGIQKDIRELRDGQNAFTTKIEAIQSSIQQDALNRVTAEITLQKESENLTRCIQDVVRGLDKTAKDISGIKESINKFDQFIARFNTWESQHALEHRYLRKATAKFLRNKRVVITIITMISIGAGGVGYLLATYRDFTQLRIALRQEQQIIQNQK